MAIEYVSIAQSRAGSAETPKKRAKSPAKKKPAKRSAPNTSAGATPAANTNHPGGESAPKTEEG